METFLSVDFPMAQETSDVLVVKLLKNPRGQLRKKSVAREKKIIGWHFCGEGDLRNIHRSDL